MHHGHSVAAAVTITAAIVLGLIVIGVVVGVTARQRVQLRVFAGLAMDEWQRARERLSWADRWRVEWATMRRRPVDRVDLALAQLARARFAQDVAGRSVVKFRWAWRALAILYGVLGAGWIVAGGLGSRMRVFHIALGMLSAATALLWAFAVPRSVARRSARMRELRAEIVRRHGRTPSTT